MLSWRIVGLGCGLACLLALVPLCSSTLRSCAAMEHPVAFQTIEEVASKARVEFPEGSRLVEGEWFGALNTYGYASVKLPADRLNEFLSQTSFAGKCERASVPIEYNPVEENPHNPALLKRWNLSKVTHSISAHVGELNSPSDRMPLALFIDTDNPRTPTAYLHWYN
jgi:hypothetical protein